MRLDLPARPPFSLDQVINAHGWPQLQPFQGLGALEGPGVLVLGLDTPGVNHQTRFMTADQFRTLLPQISRIVGEIIVARGGVRTSA